MSLNRAESGKFVHQMLAAPCKFMQIFTEAHHAALWFALRNLLIKSNQFCGEDFFFFGARSKGKKRSDGDSGANKNNIIFQVLSHRQTWNWGLLFTRLTYNRMEGNRSDQVFVISRVCSSHLSEEYITKGDIQPELCNGGRVKRSSSPSTSHNIHFHSAASGRRCQGWL